MKTIGIIDIGTNTIRAVEYDIFKHITPCGEMVEESQILKHTSNGILSEQGIAELIAVIKREYEFFKNRNTDSVYCFATSAMRDVKNFEDVYNVIKSQCGVQIELLSAEEEAICDFCALKSVLGNDCTGVGIDLGGGSCQLLYFNRGRLEFFDSYPVGVKRLYNKFGEYQIKKRETVREYLEGVLINVPNEKSECIYVMGGTGKTIRKILSEYFDIVDEFDVQYINSGKFPFNSEKNYKKYLRTGTNTIPYGIDVIEVLCKKFSVKKVKIIFCGSREGFAELKIKK